MFSAVVVTYELRFGAAGSGGVINVPAWDRNLVVLVPPYDGTRPAFADVNVDGAALSIAVYTAPELTNAALPSVAEVVVIGAALSIAVYTAPELTNAALPSVTEVVVLGAALPIAVYTAPELTNTALPSVTEVVVVGLLRMYAALEAFVVLQFA